MIVIKSFLPLNQHCHSHPTRKSFLKYWIYLNGVTITTSNVLMPSTNITKSTCRWESFETMWKEMKKRERERQRERGIVHWLLVCWGVVPQFFSSLYFILGDVVSSSFFLCNEVKWLVGRREVWRSKIRRDDRSWGYRLCSHSIGSCVFAVCHCYCFETIPHSHCPGQVYMFCNQTHFAFSFLSQSW